LAATGSSTSGSGSRLRRGRNAAMTIAAMAAPAEMAMISWNPPSEGTAAPWKSVVMFARITPETALANEVPIERISVFRLLAEAVSDGGVASMIRAGMAP
jgi:hypothetical protein